MTDIGTSKRLSVTITNEAGAAADPATLTLVVTDPNGTTDTYTYALSEITRTATGAYNRIVVPDVAGTWWYTWSATTPTVVDHGSFDVEQAVADLLARPSMRPLVQQLRGLSQAGTADWTVGAETYWTDAQLEDVLDSYRTDWRELGLTAAPEYNSGGTLEYYDYFIPGAAGKHWEGAGSQSIWAVRDAGGGTVSGYTAYLQQGRVRFSTDQAGAAYTLDASSYDLNAAAADVWRRKAAYYAESVDWQTDGHQVMASQMRSQCLAMADYYEDAGGVGSVRLVRRDVVGRNW